MSWKRLRAQTTRCFRSANYFLIYLSMPWSAAETICCATMNIPMYRHGLSLQIWVYYRKVSHIRLRNTTVKPPATETTDNYWSYFDLPSTCWTESLWYLVFGLFCLVALMNMQENTHGKAFSYIKSRTRRYRVACALSSMLFEVKSGFLMLLLL